MSFDTKRAVKLALIVVATASLAACASKPKPMPGPGPVEPGPVGPSNPNPGPSTGPVDQGVLPGSQQDFVINAGDFVYFDLDSYDVRGDALPILDAQSSWLQRYSNVQIRVEGNCDERGTREYNLALGARRANAVRDYLVSRGVSPSRISTISWGKERPVDPGTGDDAYARNRNGHTVLVSGAR